MVRPSVARSHFVSCLHIFTGLTSFVDPVTYTDFGEILLTLKQGYRLGENSSSSSMGFLLPNHPNLRYNTLGLGMLRVNLKFGHKLASFIHKLGP